MEPELEPGFDLNYPVPLSKELPGFSGSGSEPGSITRFQERKNRCEKTVWNILKKRLQKEHFWKKKSNFPTHLHIIHIIV